jgi:hypothetical protein
MKATLAVTKPVSFSGYVLRPKNKTLPLDECRYGPRNRNRQTIFTRRLESPHLPAKVRDTESSDQITDLGKIREGLVTVTERQSS